MDVKRLGMLAVLLRGVNHGLLVDHFQTRPSRCLLGMNSKN